MAKQLVRALANMAWNPEFFPDKPAHELWAKVGDVTELPEFYEDRPDLVDIWVKMGAIELVEAPKVYTPKSKTTSTETKEWQPPTDSTSEDGQ